jgi:hypothetical protein
MPECHSSGSLKEFIVLKEPRYGRYAVRGHHKPVLTHAFFLKMLKTKITSTRRPVSFGLMMMLNELLQLFALNLPEK